MAQWVYRAALRVTLGGVATTYVVACGGEVRGVDGDAPSAPASDGGVPVDIPPASGSASGGSRAPNGPQTDLPDCKLGKAWLEPTPPGSVFDCTYLVEERCYETKVAACACACKKKTGTVCSSGFPHADAPTAVTCG
jgi:hypothetical protein